MILFSLTISNQLIYFVNRLLKIQLQIDQILIKNIQIQPLQSSVNFYPYNAAY